MISGDFVSGTFIGTVRAVVGTVMDVIVVKAHGLHLLRGRVNMIRAGESGTGNQKQHQDHVCGGSHGLDYIDNERQGQGRSSGQTPQDHLAAHHGHASGVGQHGAS